MFFFFYVFETLHYLLLYFFAEIENKASGRVNLKEIKKKCVKKNINRNRHV